ncbi:hypothetical protein [Planctomycetes bacterium SV_7m_r]|uniref:hypothetical protein n=1 Tax=Stieleria bergensis TaxID=2528025 RepID=UPI00119F6539
MTEVVGNANHRQSQRNPPRPAIEVINAAALQLCKFISAPPLQTGRRRVLLKEPLPALSRLRERFDDNTAANAKAADAVITINTEDAFWEKIGEGSPSFWSMETP